MRGEELKLVYSKLTFIVLTIFSTSCTSIIQSSSGKSEWRASGKSLRYNGIITPGSSGEFSDAFNNDITDIYLSSTGGDLGATVRIMNIIRKRDISIHITGACISACPIILSAAKTKEVLPGSYLGYHWNGVSDGDSQKADAIKKGLWNSEVNESSFAAVIAGEREINKDLGIIQSLYDDASLFRKQYQKEADPSNKWPISTVIWLPTPKELSCYGLKIDKFWYPENGNLTQIPPENRLLVHLFTTKMIRYIPSAASNCIVR